MTEMTGKSRYCPEMDLRTESTCLIESGIEGDAFEAGIPAVTTSAQTRRGRQSAFRRILDPGMYGTAGMSIRTARTCPWDLHGQ